MDKKDSENGENNHPIEESEDYLINEASAICLLDKFIEVEKQLTKGGIIQDKNGKLCKDGDRIREIRYEEREGVLKWTITLNLITDFVRICGIVLLNGLKDCGRNTTKQK